MRREVVFAALFGLFVLYLALPVVGMALFSVSDGWIDTVLPTRYTADYWVAALTDPLFGPTFGRAILASLATIGLSLLLLTPTVYLLHVAAPALRPFVEAVSLAPFSLPTVVFALALIRTYSVPPLVLTGSPALLVLSYTVISLPFAYRAVDNAFRALDTKRLYEAAQTLGASSWQPLVTVILPNVRRGLAAAALLILASTFNEYTLSAFLVGDAWQTSGVWMYKLWDDHPHETLALGVLSFGVTWLLSIGILAVLGRGGRQGAVRA
ncbi:MAG TPA: ABC transporter permease subunit [Candidatus Limnocylindrales bacterium]|nr:ABC transporter permease subunit [Candidatus Limnocylindrales bacterium]